MTGYGVATEPTNTSRDYVGVWSGAFMSTWEADGYARPGAKQITLTTYNQDKVIVRLPDDVTFPRTSKNFREIDAAINDALNEYERKRRSVQLQPGDEHDTTPPRILFGDEQSAPGADDI